MNIMELGDLVGGATAVVAVYRKSVFGQQHQSKECPYF